MNFYFHLKVMNKKKERAENWSKEEKDILMLLVKDSREIIENKNTDSNTNKKKNTEWNMIHQRYTLSSEAATLFHIVKCITKYARVIDNKGMHSQYCNLSQVFYLGLRFTKLTGSKRVVAQLKGQWRRMKLVAKKNIAQHKRAIKSTGGGEKPPSPSVEDQEIMAICPIDFIEDVNHFDSDAINATIINKRSTSSAKLQNINLVESAEIQVISDSKIAHEDKPSMSSAIIKNTDIIDSTEVHTFSDITVIDEDILLNNSSELIDENGNNGSHNEQPQQQLLKDTVKLSENIPKLSKRKKKEENKKLLEKCHIKDSILQSNKEYKKKLFELQKKEMDLKILYQERELRQQSIRHCLEIEAMQLEVEIKKKRHNSC